MHKDKFVSWLDYQMWYCRKFNLITLEDFIQDQKNGH